MGTTKRDNVQHADHTDSSSSNKYFAYAVLECSAVYDMDMRTETKERTAWLAYPQIFCSQTLFLFLRRHHRQIHRLTRNQSSSNFESTGLPRGNQDTRRGIALLAYRGSGTRSSAIRSPGLGSPPESPCLITKHHRSTVQRRHTHTHDKESH